MPEASCPDGANPARQTNHNEFFTDKNHALPYKDAASR